MPCRLIINADDFGLTPGVNHAIAELHQAGVVTSTTLMATGAAFEHAAQLAASSPGLGVGCHIVLVDGIPVSPPQEIPSLLADGGRSFRPTLGRFVFDLFSGRISEEEIQREAEAQIRRLQQASIAVTHVDTHKHTHIFPSVARAVLFAAQRCGVRGLRKPFEPKWSVAASRHRVSLIRLLQISFLQRLEPRFPLFPETRALTETTNGTLGIAATGCLDAPLLRGILQAALLHDEGDPVYELVCHPGYNDGDLAHARTRLLAQREVERSALMQQIMVLRELPAAPRLIHYGDLPG